MDLGIMNLGIEELNINQSPNPSILRSLPMPALVQVNRCFAPVTPLSTPEELMTAFRADITRLLIPDPCFCSLFSPIRNSPQDDLLPNRYGKIFNKFAGEILAFMTACVSFLCCAVLYGTLIAEENRLSRQTTSAVDVFDG